MSIGLSLVVCAVPKIDVGKSANDFFAETSVIRPFWARRDTERLQISSLSCDLLACLLVERD